MMLFLFTYLTYGILFFAFLRACILIIPLLPWATFHLLVQRNWTMCDTALIIALIAILIVRNCLNKKPNLDFESHGIDDPLENPDEDCLERAQFAERVFALIDKTPIDAHMRIGIYGEWGGGKTSVLNFIKHYCEKEGNAVASFSPWQFRSKEEAWTGFVHSLDKGLSRWQKKQFGQFECENYLKKIADWAIKASEVFPQDWAKQIAQLAVAPLKGMLKETKARLQKSLKDALKEKRLYVFIDDLDRANPDVVYELLMLLNEVVDLSQCVYVIGLDRKATAHTLEGKLGAGKGIAFLEKIINWPFDLPIPSDYAWKTLLNKEMAIYPIISCDDMTSLFDVLPKNPRRFRHFIRYIASLHKGFLQRYGRDEIKCHFLYSAQLLRFEFPEEFALIVKNQAIVEHLPISYFDKTQEEENKKKPAEQHKKTEWAKEFDLILEKVPSESQKRLQRLYDNMRDACSFLSDSEVKNHLLVVEIPELFTWKEFDDFVALLKGKNHSEIIGLLKNLLIAEDNQKSIESRREFIRMLQRRRHSLLERAADVSTESEQKSFIASAQEVVKICETLMEIPELFNGNNPIFDAETIKEWYGKLTHWAHFVGPAHIYEEPRASEKNMALNIAKKISSYPLEILENLTGLFVSYRDDEVNARFIETHKTARAIIDAGVTERLFRRFEQKDGIHAIWGKSLFLYEKGLLFKGPSAFHTPENYKRLKAIADKAKDNFEIQKNFVEFCRMLFYSVTDFVDWARPDEVKQLLLNDVFREIVWTATTVNPLNGRTVGSLEEERQKLLRTVFSSDEKKLPVPKWWQDIIQSFKDRKRS